MRLETNITERGVLFRISQSYKEGMTSLELYEATRGSWKIFGPFKDAEYAFAVYKGIVKEVYEIHQWHRMGILHYKTRLCKHCGHPDGIGAYGRWEFEGKVAPEYVRRKYLGEYVNHEDGYPVKLTWV